MIDDFAQKIGFEYLGVEQRNFLSKLFGPFASPFTESILEAGQGAGKNTMHLIILAWLIRDQIKNGTHIYRGAPMDIVWHNCVEGPQSSTWSYTVVKNLFQKYKTEIIGTFRLMFDDKNKIIEIGYPIIKIHFTDNLKVKKQNYFEGLNVVYAFMDGLAHNNTQKGYRTIKYFYEQLLLRIKGHTNGQGKIFGWDYPNKHTHDFLRELSSEEKPGRIISKYNTFEFNPTCKCGDKNFEDQRKINLSDYSRKYYCVKPKALISEP